MGVFQKAYIIQ